MPHTMNPPFCLNQPALIGGRRISLHRGKRNRHVHIIKATLVTVIIVSYLTLLYSCCNVCVKEDGPKWCINCPWIQRGMSRHFPLPLLSPRSIIRIHRMVIHLLSSSMHPGDGGGENEASWATSLPLHTLPINRSTQSCRSLTPFRWNR